MSDHLNYQSALKIKADSSITNENLKDVSAEDFYKAMNIVKPSLIRTSHSLWATTTSIRGVA